MNRRIELYRYDPAGKEQGRFEAYEVPDRPGMSVMDALEFIRENIDPTLSYYHHSRCMHAICARCAVKVNGRNVLACQTPLPAEGTVRIGPVRMDRVLKDLVTEPARRQGAGTGGGPGPREGGGRPRGPRLDHLVILVRDLEEATAAYRDLLGFEVSFGGRNDEVGYRNGLVRFGSRYIELMAPTDWDQAVSTGLLDPSLRGLFETRDALALTCCLADDDLEGLAERLKQGTDLEPLGPFPLDRTRPDGRVLKWKLCLPGGPTLRRSAIPFFIRWLTPEEERLGWDPPAAHPNGAVGMLGVSVCTGDLRGARRLYEQVLGLVPTASTEDATTGARYEPGGPFIELTAPDGADSTSRLWEEAGEGPCRLALAVRDMEGFRRFLQKGGVSHRKAPGGQDRLVVEEPDRFGIELIVEAST